MNKEQIDEISLRVWNESESECDSRTGRGIITDFTHALLAELAKVSEPVVSEDELKDMASSEFESAMAFGVSRDNFMRLARSVAKLAAPLPQPDSVDEIERKEWALLMNADIEHLREQLSAAQASEAELMKALEEIADLKGTEQCEWDAAENVMPGMALIAEKAIAAHKSRKEKP